VKQIRERIQAECNQNDNERKVSAQHKKRNKHTPLTEVELKKRPSVLLRWRKPKSRENGMEAVLALHQPWMAIQGDLQEASHQHKTA